jgi:hypothetical protein
MLETARTPDQGKSNLSPVGRRYFDLIEFDDNEELMLEIRKDPIGLLMLVLIGTIIAMSVIIALFTLASSSFLTDLNLDVSRRFVAMFGFIIAVLVLILTAVYAHLYLSNVVFVTNEKIAQVLYVTLFNRKISQLNIGDVQDVTVNQKGILARLFNYGTLVIETAGEQNNYVFTFVPKPYQSSKIIITAHEASIHHYGN